MDMRSIDEKDVKDLETRGRYLRRRGFGGYRSEDVDAFLLELIRAVRRLLAENEDSELGSRRSTFGRRRRPGV